MTKIQVKARAKINFTLDILGREGEYHSLRSFVASLDLHDLVVAKKRKDERVFVDFRGEWEMPEKSNALLAGQAFVKKFQTTGADVTVYQNIPLGGGLGGSSADSAGVLNALATLYGIEDTASLKELADELGSDTGYMLQGGFCVIEGRGERIEPLAVDGRKLYLLLLIPPSGVSAKECYQKYDESGCNSPQTTDSCVQAFLRNDVEGMGKYLSNALKGPAKELNPDVARGLAELEAFAPCGFNMTGSGSVVYALFENRELRDYAYSRYRGDFLPVKAETV